MRLADTFFTERPLWQQRTRARLAAGMVLSALLVAAMLLVVRFEADPERYDYLAQQDAGSDLRGTDWTARLR